MAQPSNPFNAALVAILENKSRDEIARIITTFNVDVNQTDRHGTTLLHAACSGHRPDIVEMLLEFGADVDSLDDSGDTPLLLTLITDVDRDEGVIIQILELLLQRGANVNQMRQESQQKTPLRLALVHDFPAVVRFLLEKGADPLYPADGVSYGVMTAYDDVVYHRDKISDALAVPILEASAPLLASRNIELWTGLSRADAELMSKVFEPEHAADFAFCPFCLDIVDRIDACMYMKHTCRSHGRYYDKQAYDLYKDANGKVSWCTICGRPSYDHRHVDLQYDFYDPHLLPIQPGQDPFSTDCRLNNGGGGVPEKLMRMNAMLLRASSLMRFADRGLRKAVVTQMLITAAQQGATKDPRIGEKLMATQRWAKVDFSKFREREAAPPPAAAAAANYPNVQLPVGVTPATRIGDEPSENFLGEEGILLQFHHPPAAADDATHRITAKGLTLYLDDMNGKFGTDEFGKCWACAKKLHPLEFTQFVGTGDDDVNTVTYAKYRGHFNRKMALGQMGGGLSDFFHMSADAQCDLPRRKKGGRRTVRRRPKANKTRSRR